MLNIVEERIKRWRDKLIDLSKRNRLLNFRSTKVTTIKVTDELPSEILSILALENEGMEFLPTESSQENLFIQKNQTPSEKYGQIYFQKINLSPFATHFLLNWTTEEPNDLVTFYIVDGKVKG